MRHELIAYYSCLFQLFSAFFHSQLDKNMKIDTFIIAL